MSNTIVAKRYADALFQLANEKGVAVDIYEQLPVVKEVFETNDQLVALINNPRITITQKMDLINDTFNQVHPFILNTLKLLAQRQRLNSVLAVIDEFVRFFNEANGIAVVNIESVRELSIDEQQNLENMFKKQLNKSKVVIKNEIDPSIIGGIKARVGNTIYDGSIKGKLNRLENQIVSASK